MSEFYFGEELRLVTGEMRPAREVVDYAYLQSRAAALIDSHEQLPELELTDEPYLNAKTALFEELTASGDLSEIKFYGDQATVHFATLARIMNGWRESMPDWEKRRRFLEICEELVVHEVFKKIVTGELPDNTILNTISDCPENISFSEARQTGYRLLNQKGMLRSYHFEKRSGGWVRVLEQVSRSNSNNGSTDAFFFSKGFEDYNILGAEDALGFQFLSTAEHQPDGVIGLARDLDSLSGRLILYGEDRETAKRRGRPDYENLRRVSYERRLQLDDHVKELAEFEKSLQAQQKSGQITYVRKLLLYRQKQTEIVDRILLLSPEYAIDARGELSAKYYVAAGQALLQNDYEEFYRNPNAGSGVCGGNGEAQNFEEYAEDIYEKTGEDKSKWKWKQGVCQVKQCPTRPSKTEVGPCSVCRRCQKIFDGGGDPTKGFLSLMVSSENGKPK
jgi:hypothetical protein